jgi:hypothetical protein
MNFTEVACRQLSTVSLFYLPFLEEDLFRKLVAYLEVSQRKFAKTCILATSCLYICLSIYLHVRTAPSEFLLHSILGSFSQIYRHILVLVKMAHNGHYKKSACYSAQMYINHKIINGGKNVSNRTCRKNEMHILCSMHFLCKSCCVWDRKKKGRTIPVTGRGGS